MLSLLFCFFWLLYNIIMLKSIQYISKSSQLQCQLGKLDKVIKTHTAKTHTSTKDTWLDFIRYTIPEHIFCCTLLAFGDYKLLEIFFLESQLLGLRWRGSGVKSRCEISADNPIMSRRQTNKPWCHSQLTFWSGFNLILALTGYVGAYDKGWKAGRVRMHAK